MDYPSIIQIDDVLVSSEIITEYFACDYSKCKGCCCVIGDSGAPLEEDEPEAIEKNYRIFSPLMSPQGRETVSRTGFFEVDSDGDLVTPLVPGSEECAYCRVEEDGSCICCIERKWSQGEGDFRKPISCWLYPIRVSVLSNGMKALNLHRWEICADAFANGRRQNIRVFEFLEEPIVRYFGRDFFQALKQCAEHPF